MRSLFISQTGLTEGLGQSQVISYVTRLALQGVRTTLLSFEPQGTSLESIRAVQRQLDACDIKWLCTRRSPSHAFHTKLLESGAGLIAGLREALMLKPDIIHARSYLPAAVADSIATAVPRAKLLFDCRGMLGDEYADTGYWQRDSYQYRLLKLYERRLFRHSDAIVVLTDALRAWLISHHLVNAERLTVIPCCVDLHRFKPTEASRALTRETWGLADRFVVLYSGSLGTYYLENEMVQFVVAMAKRRANVTFLVLSRSSTTNLRRLAGEAGVGALLTIREVSTEDMPKALACGDVGLSFILESFSKKGSSPTKVAEYLAAGVPVIVNTHVGDQGELATETDACAVVEAFAGDWYRAAALRADDLGSRPYAQRLAACRRVAAERFGLDEVGVPRYAALYRSLATEASR